MSIYCLWVAIAEDTEFRVEDLIPPSVVDFHRSRRDANNFFRKLQRNRYNTSAGCGHWQQKYTQLHQDILSGRLPRRFLITIAPPQGLADRLSGTVTHFLFALITDRAFLHAAPPSIPKYSSAFDLLNIQSEMPKGFMFNEKILMNLTFAGYPESINKNKIYGLYLNAGAIEQYQTVVTRNKKLFMYGDLTTQPEGYAHTEELYVTGNRGFSWKLFRNQYHRNQLLNWGLRKETTFKCVFDYLFRLKDDACRGVCAQMRSQIMSEREAGTVIIGVQVRVGDVVFENDLNMTRDSLQLIRKHFQCASELSHQFEMAGHPSKYYFISDSLTLRMMVKRILGEKVMVSCPS